LTSDVHPVTAAIIAIGKCTAISDLGTGITALADDQDIPARSPRRSRRSESAARVRRAIVVIQRSRRG
jgi:hypothetical protein